MEFVGFYNWGGGSSGTEVITGGSNEQLPSATQNISTNEFMFFSGEFTNLSRHLIHISLFGFQSGGVSAFHRHDLRPYESLKVRNVPLQKAEVFVPSGELIGFHGMGVLRQANDEEEKTLALLNSSIKEELAQSPVFALDKYKQSSITTATTTTLWTPASDTTIGVYKITISTAGAQVLQLFFTDSAGSGGSVKQIGLLEFGGVGTFVYDFDTALLRNPNGNDGLLRCITNTTANTYIDVIGHEIKFSQ